MLDSDDDGSSRLTLTSCHPRYSASQRIAVSAELAGGRSSPVGKPVINHGRPDGAETDDPPVDTVPGEPGAQEPTSSAPPDSSTTTQPDTTSVGTEPDASGDTTTESEALPGSDPDPDAFSDGWFSDPGAYPHVTMWGLLWVALAFGAYRLCHRFHNYWSGPVVIAVPFVVTLYFFFQNVNRLMPAAF